MSSGKTLKIIDKNLVRLKENVEASDKISGGNSNTGVSDKFRFAAKRYYYNYITKDVKNGTVVREVKRLLYGNNPLNNF